MSIIAHVGLDVHQATIRVCAIAADPDKPVVDLTIANDEKSVKRHFAQWAERFEMHCCYEASSCGYVLYRWLTAMGIACDVIAPSLTPVRPGDQVKTDRRDARKLARLYRAGELQPIYVPTPEQEADRRLLRLRASTSAQVVSLKNQVHKFLGLQGLVYPGRTGGQKGSYWTKSHWKWLRSLSFSGTDALVWDEYLGQLEYFLSRLEQIDALVLKLAEKEVYRERMSSLCCLRGVAPLTAMVLLTELVDFARFPNARALMGYLGLVPREHSSGTRQSRGGLTKAGNRHVRRVLVEAAWKYTHKPTQSVALKSRQAGCSAQIVSHCWKAQERLYKKYWSVAGHAVSQKAAVAVARELCGFIWSLMTQFGSSQTITKAAS